MSDEKIIRRIEKAIHKDHQNPRIWVNPFTRSETSSVEVMIGEMRKRGYVNHQTLSATIPFSRFVGLEIIYLFSYQPNYVLQELGKEKKSQFENEANFIISKEVFKDQINFLIRNEIYMLRRMNIHDRMKAHPGYEKALDIQSPGPGSIFSILFFDECVMFTNLESWTENIEGRVPREIPFEKIRFSFRPTLEKYSEHGEGLGAYGTYTYSPYLPSIRTNLYTNFSFDDNVVIVITPLDRKDVSNEWGPEFIGFSCLCVGSTIKKLRDLGITEVDSTEHDACYLAKPEFWITAWES